MRLKNSIDYKRFPEPSRGDWTRFTILVLSATLLGPCSRLRKQLAVFVDRPRRKLAYVRGWAAETDMRAVRPGGCESKGLPGPPRAARDAASAAPRNLVHPHIVLSPNSRTSAPPMDIQNAPPRAPRADIGQWRTATTRIAQRSGISVRLFGKERYRGPHSRSS